MKYMSFQAFMRRYRRESKVLKNRRTLNRRKQKSHKMDNIFGSNRETDWKNEKVRFLGVNFWEIIDELNEEIFHDIIQKMMQSLHLWRGKYISRKGMPQNVNTYSLSLHFLHN